MDAIRKKMQSLKGETDVLYATIAKFEGVTKDANSQSDQHEADIRDLGKKIQGYECDFDETNDKLIKAMTALEEKEKAFKTAEEEVRQFWKHKMSSTPWKTWMTWMTFMFLNQVLSKPLFFFFWLSSYLTQGILENRFI